MLTAPGREGAYYYGACVDAVAGESDTANNCSGSVQGKRASRNICRAAVARARETEAGPLQEALEGGGDRIGKRTSA